MIEQRTIHPKAARLRGVFVARLDTRSVAPLAVTCGRSRRVGNPVENSDRRAAFFLLQRRRGTEEVYGDATSGKVEDGSIPSLSGHLVTAIQRETPVQIRPAALQPEKGRLTRERKAPKWPDLSTGMEGRLHGPYHIVN